jgi:3-oxoadipate enol-lactonase
MQSIVSIRQLWRRKLRAPGYCRFLAFAEVNGAGLYFDIAGRGDPVVLVHGGLMDSRIWDTHLDAFAARYRVIRYDLRGHGRSSPPNGPFSHARDLEALLDHLELRRASLVAHSLGGRAALELAVDRPNRVSALVAVDAGLPDYPTSVPEESQRAAEAAASQADLAAAVQIWLSAWAPLGSEGQLRELALANADALGVGELERPLEPPARDRLSELTAPTLVLVGDRDLPHIQEIAELLARGIPHARKAVVREADHYPHVRRPEEFRRLVFDFLDEVFVGD